MKLEDLPAPVLRRQIEHAIEALIALLDDIDGDPDLEADDADDEEDDNGLADQGGLTEQRQRYITLGGDGADF